MHRSSLRALEINIDEDRSSPFHHICINTRILVMVIPNTYTLSLSFIHDLGFGISSPHLGEHSFSNTLRENIVFIYGFNQILYVYDAPPYLTRFVGMHAVGERHKVEVLPAKKISEPEGTRR